MSSIDIIIPVYFNSENLDYTVPKLLDLKSNLKNIHFIFIDDGSKDDSYEILKKWKQKYDNEITLVKLTKNFGSMAAILAGFHVAKGDWIGMISADLQDPPELFIDMYNHANKGIKAIFAIRKKRPEKGFQAIINKVFYFLFNHLAIKGYPSNGFDFFLIHKDVKNVLVNMNEKNTNLMALMYWLGFPSIMIPYERKERVLGKSRWTLSKKIKLFIDSFVGFSYFPIRFMSFLGMLISFISLFYVFFLIAIKIFQNIDVPGFTTLAVLIALFSGIQLFTLGVLGEYLWRILDQVRNRPSFIINEILE